jgi:hypothetical protein
MARDRRMIAARLRIRARFTLFVVRPRADRRLQFAYPSANSVM